MVAHVVCIRARWRRDHAKSHAVIPPCMAQINDLSSCRKIHNILISRTLGLNLMPFASEPFIVHALPEDPPQECHPLLATPHRLWPSRLWCPPERQVWHLNAHKHRRHLKFHTPTLILPA